MKPEIEKLINKYLHFGGDKELKDFAQFFKELVQAKFNVKQGTHDYRLLEYVQAKIVYGMQLCIQHGAIYVMVDEDSIEDIEEAINGSELSGKQTHQPQKPKPTVKPKAKPKKKKGGDLGKIVDHGKTAPEGNSDAYWGREGKMNIVFMPNDEKVRVGEHIPPTYKYADMRFLESYYGLKAFEFGNWLSQQDRLNYLSGLGLALFDLHKLIGFTPQQLSIDKRLSVSFGARGRGKANAHFEPGTFVINLTRYSRPQKLAKRTTNFKRVNLILQDGGVGSFSHEYGHALDFFAGTFIEKTNSFQLSGGDSVNPKPKEGTYSKTSLRGLMDTLLNKIIWKSKNIYTDYYKKLITPMPAEYYIRRNEIFARAFEVYIHYKLNKHKHKHKNIFLSKVKYASPRNYLTLPEMKKIEKDFDALINAIKKHL